MALFPAGAPPQPAATTFRRARRFALAAAGLLLLGYGLYLVVRIGTMRREAPERVAAILADADPGLRHITPRRIAALLRVEDPTFWTNDGTDFYTPGAGYTSLSQGLGKHLFFDRFIPVVSKPELILLTRFALTPTVSKRDILVAFLATAYLGDDRRGPVIGFAEGAQRWFGKPLDGLSDREFLALVAMLPAPNRLDPRRHPRASAERVARIENLLAGRCAPTDLGDVELEDC